MVVNHRYGLHYDGTNAARICPLSQTLTREGWQLLISDALADEGLVITDGRQGTSGCYQDKAAMRRFLDSFVLRWNRLLNNELPQFRFDPAQWTDLISDPPPPNETNRGSC